MIEKDLLDILVCPACKKALDYRQNPESLKCTACRRVYPVRDNIPIMLIDEAVTENGEVVESGQVAHFNAPSGPELTQFVNPSARTVQPHRLRRDSKPPKT